MNPSSPSDLSEFLPPFIAEAEELLATARANMLAVEAEQRRGKAHPRAVRETFRSIHTLKGLSAMVDVQPIVELSHLMESTLRVADRAGGTLAADAIESILEGIGAVAQRVHALEAGQPVAPPPAPLLEKLEALLHPVGTSVTRQSSEARVDLDPALLAKLTAFEREQLLEGVKAGRRAVRYDFAPSPKNAAQGLNINSVRERVGKVAEIIKVLPLSVPASESRPGGLIFALLLLTRESDESILSAVGGGPEGLQTLGVHPANASVSGASEADAGAATAASGVDRPADAFTFLPEDEDTGNRRGLVRVDPARLDDAMDGIGALIVNRSRLLREVAALTAAGVNTRELAQVLAENKRLLRDLRGSVVRLRMVRVSDTLERLPLMVRGLQRATGKEVALHLDVGQAELDKAVGDALFPAVVHLVRNAVDHALESPDERERLGKPREGSLRVLCHERSNARLELVVEDDGRGIDSEAVARRAGVATPASSDQLLELLCRPGLSTRDEVTTTSGRGMGMDIVRRIIVDKLGGELQLETEPGRGTRFIVSVPLTISILDAFIFEAGEQRFAAAVSTIEELFEVEPTDVVQAPSPGQHGSDGLLGMVHRRGAALPLLKLDSLLSLERAGVGRKAIVVHNREQPLAFLVDRMVSQQEIVLRPLEDPLVRIPGVAGATDLGDGRPTVVLDLVALGAVARGERQQ